MPKNIYDEIGTPSIKHNKAICKLIEPLSTYFGIDRFWRNSHEPDGTYSVIGNHPATAELFFGQNLFIGHPYFRNPKFFQSGYTLPSLLQNKNYEETQGKLARDSDCHHVFLKIVKPDKGFIEYGFATSKLSLGFEIIYINHLAAINKFVDYFEENAQKIIQTTSEYKVKISELIGSVYEENPKVSSNVLVPEKELCFLFAIEKHPEKAKALSTLTKSEKSCLKLYAQGKTAKEIAKMLYRSPRTIESHLEIAKSKLNCPSRSSLIEFLLPFVHVL